MIIEHLHIQKGDKKKDLSTDTEQDRMVAQAYIAKLLKQGTALFLERNKKTYRIRGYDPKKDKLIVEPAEGRKSGKKVEASSKKGRVAAVPPIKGGSTNEEELVLDANGFEEETVEVEINLTREQLEAYRQVPHAKKNIIKALADMLMAKEMQTRVIEFIKRKEAGEDITWETMVEEMNAIAIEHGYEGGIPMPCVGDNPHPLFLANGSPLSNVMEANNANITEWGQQLAFQRTVRNSWNRLQDEEICIVDTDEGPMTMRRPMAGGRLRKLMADMEIRHEIGSLTVEAEFKAMENLKERVNENQYRQYILNGVFPERSKRSDIFYFFRKGRPTLACSGHDGKTRCIATLCFHPHGYYGFSHVGVMTPTDEVIAALIMMRGDERRFWAKSGQWQAADPRSGL